MNLREKMQKIQEEEALKAIRLDENKIYNAVIENCYFGKNAKNLNAVTFSLKIKSDDETNGKIINKIFVIDEANPSKLQTEIALKELFILLQQWPNFTFETEKDLAQKLPTLIDQEVTLKVIYKINKQDITKVWPNYYINKN